MENETGPIENDSEVVESNEEINENGCDKQDEVDGAIDTDDKTETEPTVQGENKTEDEECLSPMQAYPIDEAPSETDQFAVIDSDNPSENSPDKGQTITCTVSSPSEVETEETANDKNWNHQSNDSSPEKSRSDTACIISSPSEVEGDESANDKGWTQLNESVSEDIYDDSMDEEPESEEDEFIDRSSPKVVFKDRESGEKPAVDCQVFELTDDNSSVDDARSEMDDDIEGEDMGEEEDSGKAFNWHFCSNRLEMHTFSNSFISFICLDYSEVHNIDDSDDEPFVEEQNIQSARKMSASHSANIDIKVPIKSYDSERTFEDDDKFGKHSAIRVSSNSGQCRNYLKSMLEKQSASKLQRYLAVKRSIKWYVCHFITIPFYLMFRQNEKQHTTTKIPKMNGWSRLV